MERQRIFILMWTIANVLSFGTLWFLVVAIVRSRRARAQKFNIYLVFSVLPDMIKNTLFFVMNLVNFMGFKPWACTAIGWGEVFNTCANYWMGAIVTHEVYNMLVATKKCIRVSRIESLHNRDTTTWRKLLAQSTTVHLFALAMASTVLETSVDWIPDVSIETQCEAFPRNAKEAYYFWFCYVFLGMMLPSIYLLYVCLDIYWNGLLPISGKTRFLALYFFRLIAIFVGFWIIFVVAVFLKGWAQAIAFVFFNLTGFVSFCFAVTKPDVREACLDLLFCRDQRSAPEEMFVSRFMTQSQTLESAAMVLDSNRMMVGKGGHNQKQEEKQRQDDAGDCEQGSTVVDSGTEPIDEGNESNMESDEIILVQDSTSDEVNTDDTNTGEAVNV